MNNKGFALAETLLAVIFVALSGLIIAGALNVSVNTYSDIKSESNVKLVCDEYLERIRELVRCAKLSKETSGNCFYSEEYGALGELTSVDGELAFKTQGINHFLLSRRDFSTEINEKEKICAEIECEILENVCVKGKIKVMTADEGKSTERSFCFYPNSVLIN